MAREDINRIKAVYVAAKNARQPFEADWRMAAMHVLPMHFGAWNTEGRADYTGGRAAPQRVAFDTTGARSLPKYVALLERLATPAGQKWHKLQPSDLSLRKKNRVRQYFDELTNLMFKMRDDPRARFRLSFSETYRNMGVYGNGPLYVGERRLRKQDRNRGLMYVACPMRDCFALYDDEGNMYGFFRRFWLNARQFKTKFPDETPPRLVKAELDKPTPDEARYFEFFHYVRQRIDDYDPKALGNERHPYLSSYVSFEDAEYVGDDTGFQSMPYIMPRVTTVAGLDYGFSPAVAALSAMGGASQIKKTHLKQGNKAVDPVILAHDDNAMNGTVDLRPGAINYGGIDKQGRKLIDALPSGNFRVGELLLQDERKDIEDNFFVTLFQILTDTPEMTATEVMERVAEKAALMSPTMGSVQTELLGPNIEREISVLSELGLMPEMPPELVEAEGEYEIVYTSPLAKTMYAEEISGFMRTLEMTTGIVNATQDPSALDAFDFDTAIPEIADYMAVPARWMASDDKIAEKRNGRAEQQQQAELMKNAPALASAAKTATEMQGGAK